jgi:predicted ArsR family transcriptional regulator
MADGFDPPISPTQRFTMAVTFLNKMAYRARWEAGPDGPHFQLRSCPYAAILEQHPELCEVDHRFLERLVQTPLLQTTRMNLITGVPSACVFLTVAPGPRTD